LELHGVEIPQRNHPIISSQLQREVFQMISLGVTKMV